MNQYRFDNRSQEQFANDIKECTKLERELMIRYVAWLNLKSHDKPYSFKDNGVDNTGAFIEDPTKLSSKADFILYKNKGRPRKIEIKHCKPNRTRFHIKLAHIKRCIDENICIINWMGVETDSSRFCIITPTHLADALRSKKIIKMWGKDVLRFECKHFDWILDANKH